jgi:membrane-associated phospholipid phosphatase
MRSSGSDVNVGPPAWLSRALPDELNARAMTSPARPGDDGFARRFAGRLGAYPAIKAVGLTLGIAVFFAVYFHVLNHPVFPVTIMPLMAVDRLVGLHPWTVPLYVSLWVYVPLAFVLLRTRRELLAGGIAAFVLAGIGLGVFYLWPTAVPVLEFDWTAHPSLAVLKSVDASGNACPSLHVAFAVFTAIRLVPLLSAMGAGAILQGINGLWCLGIVFSTLATGQHVALDALAGAALGALVAQLPDGTRHGASCSGAGTTQR